MLNLNQDIRKGGFKQEMTGEEILAALAEIADVKPFALARFLRRSINARDEDEQPAGPLTFWDDADLGTQLGDFHESAPGTALTVELHPYSIDGGGGEIEVSYNGGGSATITVTSPRGDAVKRTIVEDQVVMIRLPIVNGTVLEVTMGDGGNFTIVGNPNQDPIMAAIKQRASTVGGRMSPPTISRVR